MGLPGAATIATTQAPATRLRLVQVPIRLRCRGCHAYRQKMSEIREKHVHDGARGFAVWKITEIHDSPRGVHHYWVVRSKAGNPRGRFASFAAARADADNPTRGYAGAGFGGPHREPSHNVQPPLTATLLNRRQQNHAESSR